VVNCFGSLPARSFMPMKDSAPVAIRIAESPGDIAQARDLFRQYGASLGFPLCFQNFEQELATLPGKYALPAGRLLLAFVEGAPVGCGALRPLDHAASEMKRLYVRPEYKGRGIGRQLAERLIAEAKLIGYTRMRLDTIPALMMEASRLYLALGFHEIPPYYNSPQTGPSYMELPLE
jgi:GNAT superfamily N-acetyltransferase